MEYRLIAKDGRVVWVRDEAAPMLDEEGRPERWRGVLLDITERKEAEEALKKSEERFLTVFESPAVGIGRASRDGGWIEVNGKLCGILGYEREEMLGMTFWEMTPSEDMDDSRERFGQILKGKLRSYLAERRFVRKDGSRVWAEVNVSVSGASSGEPDHFFCVVEDTTQRKLSELVPDRLTDGEMEVLRLVVLGQTNREIAGKLRYSVGNVKHRIRRVIVKLGVENRRQAADRAVEIGLIVPPY